MAFTAIHAKQCKTVQVVKGDSKTAKPFMGFERKEGCQNYGMYGLYDLDTNSLHMVCYQTKEQFCEPVHIPSGFSIEEINELANQQYLEINNLT